MRWITEDLKIVQFVQVNGRADGNEMDILWFIVNVTETDLLMSIGDNVEAGAGRETARDLENVEDEEVAPKADRETTRDLENVGDEDAVPGADRHTAQDLKNVRDVDAIPGVGADPGREQDLLAGHRKMHDRVSLILLN